MDVYILKCDEGGRLIFWSLFVRNFFNEKELIFEVFLFVFS